MNVANAKIGQVIYIIFDADQDDFTANNQADIDAGEGCAFIFMADGWHAIATSDN
jgi:hypothetical protein